jgi:ferric-dicitrate binding protein FerR (iron transport regulator)
MSCRQFEPDVIDHARGITLEPARQTALEGHLRACTSCAVLAERQRAISAALRRLAREQKVPLPSDRALQTLLASFDVPRRQPRRLAVGIGLSVAASVLIVAGLYVGWKDGRPASSTPVAAAPAAAPVDGTFVPVAGASALPRFERGEVIRVEMPSAAGLIQADVLVGQDGLARAVRLVQ